MCWPSLGPRDDEILFQARTVLAGLKTLAPLADFRVGDGRPASPEKPFQGDAEAQLRRCHAALARAPPWLHALAPLAEETLALLAAPPARTLAQASAGVVAARADGVVPGPSDADVAGPSQQRSGSADTAAAAAAVCEHCFAPREMRGLMRCARCKAVRYCSRACQEAAWSAHKAACKRVAAQKAGEAAAGMAE